MRKCQKNVKLDPIRPRLIPEEKPLIIRLLFWDRAHSSLGRAPTTHHCTSRTMMMVKKLWGGDGETNTLRVGVALLPPYQKVYTHQCWWVTRFLIRGFTIRGLCLDGGPRWWGGGSDEGVLLPLLPTQLPLTTHNSCYICTPYIYIPTQ